MKYEIVKDFPNTVYEELVCIMELHGLNNRTQLWNLHMKLPKRQN